MAPREQRVTPLELFFDLVFVYAVAQVTLLMSDDPTWHGIGRGLLVLAALWWAWTNVTDVGTPPGRTTCLAHRQQIDDEHQRFVRLDHAARSSRPVGH